MHDSATRRSTPGVHAEHVARALGSITSPDWPDAAPLTADSSRAVGPAAWLRNLLRRCTARVERAEFHWYPTAPFAPDLAGGAGPLAARLIEWNGPL
ncbi:hypothetical protein [Nocardia bovistercoris]|uniref:Uncharacterized protein n=1 Tax=Nocardia bovistercoris TaxID=2785916 RepID=A0A931IEM9_9NOCA|nr:hypothetical protein [Nocardia bovistercoris]MBH0780084.1 hypothetical protein [Nocardia bovistercoris]